MAIRKKFFDSWSKDKFDTEIAFIFWAFGDVIPMTTETKRDAWNARHGDKLYLAPTDKIAESLAKMLRIYNKECLLNSFVTNEEEDECA